MQYSAGGLQFCVQTTVASTVFWRGGFSLNSGLLQTSVVWICNRTCEKTLRSSLQIKLWKCKSSAVSCPAPTLFYTQEVGRAGRDGSKAEAILCYNGTDLAQRHVDRSVKEYCKERKSCRRAFISSYFDSTVSVPDQDCCDVCDTSNSCSQVLKSRDYLNIPTLTKRQQLFDILNA